MGPLIWRSSWWMRWRSKVNSYIQNDAALNTFCIVVAVCALFLYAHDKAHPITVFAAVGQAFVVLAMGSDGRSPTPSFASSRHARNSKQLPRLPSIREESAKDVANELGSSLQREQQQQQKQQKLRVQRQGRRSVNNKSRHMAGSIAHHPYLHHRGRCLNHAQSHGTSALTGMHRGTIGA
mmetsp:Transcript_946/g.1897  ORF Transcript_946/g.1897 Transcript_946/m.1897 type:complete len:180 (-) Transcript_946:125-664(-)